MKAVIVVVATAAIGGFAGWIARGSPPVPEPVAAPAPARSLSTPLVTRPPPSVAPARDSVAAPAVAPAEPSPEQLARIASVERAIADGAWTEDDRALLRGSLAGLDRADADALMSTLFVAINERRVKPALRGPLL